MSVYLDHAATSFPKPPDVTAAVLRWYADYGVSPDRGDSDLTAVVRAVFERTRARVASLCGVPATRVAWTSGATESLHLFLLAVLKPGHRVLATACAHSSVARPLVTAREALGIELEVLPVDRDGRLDPADVVHALHRSPRDLLVLNHASNVTGVVQDVEPCLRAARDFGVTSLLDASQTMGTSDVAHLPADAIAASAHKALLGPPGLGFLATVAGLDLTPPKPGGSGSSHALDRHPLEWPTAFEAGTPNSPAVFGLDAALAWRAAHPRRLDPSPGRIALGELAQRLVDTRPSRRVLAADSLLRDRPDQLPILSFTDADWDPAELGILLDQAGFQVRSGFHCAPWIHRFLGTPTGTLRISPGPFVPAERILAIADALP